MKSIVHALLFLIITLSGCNAAAKNGSGNNEKGRILEKSSAYGDYLQYIPSSLNSNSRILIIAHGSLEKRKSALYLAKKFIKRWVDTSEKEGIILIAPAFDRKNYQSYGGYRGLFGRDVGADEFVNNIVDSYRNMGANSDGRFYLYGHSAGGQFAIRYSVRHPNRLIKAVMSAPGRFAFPDGGAPWPYGMGVLQRNIEYKDPDEVRFADVRPDYYGWVKASELPITIVVGSQDLEKQPKRAGHRGRTRIDLANNWAYDMNKLAEQNGKEGNVVVKTIQGVGHSSKRLTPYCVNELF